MLIPVVVWLLAAPASLPPEGGSHETLLVETLLVPSGLSRKSPQLDAIVIDKATREPIAGAEITILGHAGERYTDVTGRFT